MRKLAKHLIQSALRRLGYQFTRLEGPYLGSPINVLDLAVRHEIAKRKDWFFIQVGAHDGSSLDPIREYVTRYHWRGILIEPQPRIFEKLVRNYAAEKQLLFENAAVAANDGRVKFYAYKDPAKLPYHATMLAGLNRASLVKNGHDYVGEIEELDIPAISVPTLLRKHGVSRIDLLQIDAEGFDFEIVRMFIEAGCRPTIISFESACPSPEAQACFRLLTEHGYQLSHIAIDTIAYLQEDAESFRDKLKIVRQRRIDIEAPV